MSEQNANDSGDLERRTKQVFDRSTTELDAATRSRLTQARYRALQELRPHRSPLFGRRLLVPIGAAATAVLAAWLAFAPPRPSVEADLKAAAIGDLEILLGDEDIEMLDEEIEFYAWLEDQPEFTPPAAGDGVG